MGTEPNLGPLGNLELGLTLEPNLITVLEFGTLSTSIITDSSWYSDPCTA